MTGFTTIETRREMNYQNLSWQTGLTVEEVRDLFKNQGGYYEQEEKEEGPEANHGPRGLA